MTTRLSKSKFIAGVQCLKRLYLQVHQPELAAEPDGTTEAIMQQGHDVGMLARELFPGGVEVRSDRGLDQAIRTTRELVANRDAPAIFEGVFEHQNVLVKVDILHRRGDGRFRLIEAKSTTDLKDHHLDDVAIQYRVVSRSGLDVASACLAHVNRGYVFDGQSIDAKRFFKIRNLTRRVVKLQPKLTFLLRSEFIVLGMPKAPDIAPGRHCADPVTCEFYDRCNTQRPDDHIGFIPRIHASAMEELEEMGIESIREIPDDFELSEIQRRAATCVQTGEPWFSTELSAELDKLEYPLYFMDFETVNRAIPPFTGMRPYDHLPFQFSVHVQQQPGAEAEHHEHLATDGNDPRREFISSLCSGLGNCGSIVVYSSFESQRLSELAAWLPEFADRISDLQGRLFDLLPIVREHTYHPAYAGSYSIKSVLPALVPEMTYDGMEVANGQDAGLAWESLVRGGLGRGEHERIRKALLDYCGQDTLAMVRLLHRLQSAAQINNEFALQWRSMADAYEVWLDQVKDALRSINMQMEDWQGIWSFDFSAEYKAGTNPDAAAMKANRFWWCEQNKSIGRACDKVPGCWLPLGHQGECQPNYEPGDHIKVEFEGENGMPGEWMWVIVQSRDDKKRIVYGTLDNEPVNEYGGKVKLGSELAISYDNVREHGNASKLPRRNR